MTFTEKFDALKNEYYARVDVKKLTEDFAIQVEMTDEDCGGIFYIAYIGGVFSFEPYDYVDNTARIRTSSEVLEQVLSGKQNPVLAVTSGKAEVFGKAEHVLGLIAAVKKPRKKRTTTKKAEK